MKHIAISLPFIAAFTALAHGASAWEWMLKPADVKYIIYGGELGDPYAATRHDIHAAFYIRGQAAKEMFKAMGPDKKSVCFTEKGGRIREKEHITCRFRPSQGYECDFGFDLTSGKSIGGSIC
ncbi:hypothetical protein MJ904_08110 [Massilia sp. MB5]|uniref:hypothetical protein n=1 Tax=Massilia sp. MB5 TaxID=2919578 RepID=UPI001F0D8B31|nr:hypothetical protein [Massilia sp. MB5]UMR32124.1 hypothetical protein MJ904_08110 [Massilia sp. MB5]